MPRYIDADALKVEYEQMLPDIGDGYHKETLQDVLFELEHAPTISPDEVRGVGKWEKDSDGLDVCSECGEVALQRVFIKLPDKIVDLKMICSNYCPNCGAKMEVTDDA